MKKIFLILAIISITSITFSQNQAGDVWIEPAEQTVNVNEDVQFNIRVNTGTKVITSYGIDILYNQYLLNVNTNIGLSGVEAGLDGFIAAVNPNEPGILRIAGFDAVGKGPGANLHLLIIHMTAKE